MELHDQTAAAHELVAVIVLDGLRWPDDPLKPWRGPEAVRRVRALTILWLLYPTVRRTSSEETVPLPFLSAQRSARTRHRSCVCRRMAWDSPPASCGDRPSSCPRPLCGPP